ncbi:MAG: hypothetical protein KDI36_20470, partial [Pseudomonadales bacterium]|nr:hypothetical protein [Pseudomonadales bacterium]
MLKALLLCTVASYFLPKIGQLDHYISYGLVVLYFYYATREWPIFRRTIEVSSGALIAVFAFYSALSTIWSDQILTNSLKDIFHLLLVSCFTGAVAVTTRRHATSYQVLVVILTGALAISLAGLGGYFAARHSTEAPRLAESWFPVSRCQIPLDKPNA